MLINLKSIPDGTLLHKRFLVMGKLGQGGSGTVYRVMDQKDKVKKALKAIKLDREGSQEFRHEVDILNKLQNASGIPTLHKFYTDTDMNALVTDLFLGDLLSLTQKSPAKKLDLSSVLTIGYYLFCILEQVHAKGIVHRDIKSNNICLKFSHQNHECPLALIDFGLSDVIDPKLDYKDATRKTYPYSTPAMIEGNACSKQDDCIMAIYSLLEMMGEHVFSMFHGAGSRADIVAKKVKFEVQPMEIQPHRWIADLIIEVKSKSIHQCQNYSRLRSIIKTAKRNFQPKRNNLEVKTTEDGKYYL